ncbi:centriolar and ciliogenesis-associated protein HYLS1-like [Corticium candelabrum]|uniref:centriolar and ciliogenesis-associated protein HYLS1-like n=1 Tax=Corticium candelabrum TaxID=121492 RepID=UPI002E272154|nr:centriolar and ciliogenesis-associated protein HYLS1-like [Corticium candelabrum]
MANGLWFTEEDVRHELEKLGFKDVSDKGLQSFSEELKQLVFQQKNDSNNTSDVSLTDNSTTDAARDAAVKSRPAYDVTSGSDSDSTLVSAADHVAARRPHRAISKTVIRRIPEKENWDSVDERQQTEKQQVTGHDELSSSCASLSESKDWRQKSKSKSKMPKRIVLRRKNGESRVFDESVCESEQGEQRPVVRLREDSDRAHSEDSDVENRVGLPTTVVSRPSSFIRPLPHPALSRRKSDPVARYHDYRQYWLTFKVPGEDNRDSLRWNLREQLLRPDPLPYTRPRRMPPPSSYIPPPEKKRQALRWETRHNMAAPH